MKCPACRSERTNEYFHVLTIDPSKDSYRFNYCCSECLAERLRVPRHIRWEFTDKDREEIRKIVWTEIGRLLDIQRRVDDEAERRLGHFEED